MCLCLCLSFLCVCVCRGLFRGFIDHFCRLVGFCLRVIGRVLFAVCLRVSSARPLAPIVTTLYAYIYICIYIYICMYISTNDLTHPYSSANELHIHTHIDIYVYIYTYTLYISTNNLTHPYSSANEPYGRPTYQHAFRDGYCSTIPDMLDWFNVDLGFPELVLFRLI